MMETEGSPLSRESSISHCKQSYHTVLALHLSRIRPSIRGYLVFVKATCRLTDPQTVLNFWCDEVHDFLHRATPSHDQWTHQPTHSVNASVFLPFLESETTNGCKHVGVKRSISVATPASPGYRIAASKYSALLAAQASLSYCFLVPEHAPRRSPTTSGILMFAVSRIAMGNVLMLLQPGHIKRRGTICDLETGSSNTIIIHLSL